MNPKKKNTIMKKPVTKSNFSIKNHEDTVGEKKNLIKLRFRAIYAGSMQVDAGEC